MEAAGTSICVAMKAVLLSGRWAGWARLLGLEQQGRECQAAELAQAALALAGEVDRVSAHGTVDEKRAFIRAFLREIEFDPQSRTGTAYFYAVPSVNGDAAPDPGGGTRYEPPTTGSGVDGSESPSDG